MSLWRHNVAFGGTYVARVMHVITTSDVTVRWGVAPWLADGAESRSDSMMVRSRVLTSAWIILCFPPSSMSAGPTQCGKVFTRRANLKRHQRAHQPVSRCHQCSICQKNFSRNCPVDLFRHCRLVHHQEAMELVYEAISPGSPLRDEQPVVPADLLWQAAQQVLGVQQMEQYPRQPQQPPQQQQPPQLQHPPQLPPLLNPALVVRAVPGAGAALHQQLRMTPSGVGVGVSLSGYGRLDQGDVMMQAPRDLPGYR